MNSANVQPCSFLRKEQSYCSHPKIQDFLVHNQVSGGIRHPMCPLATECNRDCHREMETPPTIIVPNQIPVRRPGVPLRSSPTSVPISTDSHS